MTRLVCIAAVAENGVIGRDGDMPWHYSADLRHFKETTMGHPVVMGRTTYESIAGQLDGPLPGRTNVVLSRSNPDLPEEVVLVHSVEEAIETVEELDDTAFVIGGATVYEQFLPHADELILTEIHDEYEGDTHFPEWDPKEWTEVERDEREELDFVRYER
ncbi:Dihydrofolate reductase [Haladaptatus paucihalophilus DX253]|uniref:dihydrofolate reductase n=1 Tax=Haladaptatus paucihalophilus DX253 TaxID=797209 RepID=E7QN03_HALPU|nr:dihydrofolate reductase [Haladaptatus paucihalophilus]EFW93798.1 Dihydrofolate reductase [Haladaptatus paucihalophilus DX253]SHL51425.1 dihydrofolate reductase [Haladaptatus paucihalophilus DX253]